MKRNLVKLLLASLLLCSVALAADRSTGTFLQNATTGSYRVIGSSLYLAFQATTDRLPNGVKRAYLNIYANDWTDGNWRYLEAWGFVPLSVLRVSPSGNTLSINISDLRELVPAGFYLSEFNFFGRLP
jgi:hypothetical protein